MSCIYDYTFDYTRKDDVQKLPFYAGFSAVQGVQVPSTAYSEKNTRIQKEGVMTKVITLSFITKVGLEPLGHLNEVQVVPPRLQY